MKFEEFLIEAKKGKKIKKQAYYHKKGNSSKNGLKTWQNRKAKSNG